MIIVDDAVFEPTENFTVSLALESVENFDSNRVIVDPDLATITITDDDSKLSACNQYLMIHVYSHHPNHSFHTGITVIVDSPQLGPPDYTVPEDTGTFQICLNVTQPPSDVTLVEIFDIMVTTADDTAGT